jgi:glucosylglycerate phosphorylase
MSCMARDRYAGILTTLYDSSAASYVERRLLDLIESHRGEITEPLYKDLTERDVMLITYCDQVRSPSRPHLKSLAEFCENRLSGLINCIHILPFYPWSSDDGFSVKDYREVDTALGIWKDVERLGKSFRPMFDGVINHSSAQGKWFQAFLRDELPYRDYFLTVQGIPDLSRVVRPRTLPLLTEFQTTAGPRKAWTTFSADQVDLDFHNPDVLLDIFDILLTYARHGAQFIRLDAIAYLWKEIGTTCLHLPQTHAVVQLLRAVFDDVAPHMRIITETNVPHSDNISYFGDGKNEAHLVYNFALPPLVLHTLLTGNSAAISQWTSSLKLPSDQTTFFNFLASHDGIGLNPVRGILSDAEIETLVRSTLDHGGLVSFKTNPDGSQSPYEMNINYFDALSNPAGDEPVALQVDRFMAAQAIMLMISGLPGIYFHSLFGSRGWKEGVKLTGQNRTINRQKLDRTLLETELDTPASLRAQVFNRYRNLITQRAANPAFHPQGQQTVLDMGTGIFALSRTSPDSKHQMLCLQNITFVEQTSGAYRLAPYQTLWLNTL